MLIFPKISDVRTFFNHNLFDENILCMDHTHITYLVSLLILIIQYISKNSENLIGLEAAYLQNINDEPVRQQ